MPSVGRKLLMAGRGGLNLTHAEPLPVFLARYGAARGWLEPIIAAFPPEALIALVQRSGPADLHRLQRAGVSDRDEGLAAAARVAAAAWRSLGVQVRGHAIAGPAGTRTEALRFETPDGDGA